MSYVLHYLLHCLCYCVLHFVEDDVFAHTRPVVPVYVDDRLRCGVCRTRYFAYHHINSMVVHDAFAVQVLVEQRQASIYC